MLVVLALALAGQAFGQSTVPVLVAHWTGDVDGTTVLDASGNGYSGTLYGATSVDDGIDGGRAFYFGGDDYLVIDQRLSFAQEDYTVEGWFNTGVTPHTNVYQAVFAASTWGDRSSHGVYVALQGRSWGGTTGPGSLRYLHRPIGGSSGGLDIISGFSVADGEWHHFAATRIGTHNTLYIDGAIVEDFYFNEDLGPRGSQVFSSDWPERGIQLTQVPEGGTFQRHGGLSAGPAGVGNTVRDRGRLSEVLGATALAGRICLPSLRS